MIKVRDCAFQDGSYPCGYKDEGNLPDCDLCHKIRKAGIKEIVDWLNKRIYLRTDGMFETELLQIPESALDEDGVKRVWELQIIPQEWQSKLKEWGICSNK